MMLCFSFQILIVVLVFFTFVVRILWQSSKSYTDKTKTLKDGVYRELNEQEAMSVLKAIDKKDPSEEEEYISGLRNKLHVSLERVRLLEAEVDKLKDEVQHLKKDDDIIHARDVNKIPIQTMKPPVKKIASKLERNTTAETRERLSNSSSSELECSSLQTKTSKPVAPPPPPPPPPPPSKLSGRSKRAIRRVPEVVELYRCLTRKEPKAVVRAGSTGPLATTNPREMIGEIENKSAYLSAIKSDVETHGEFINFLIREVENAAYKEMCDLEVFVNWLDKELSYLIDERAVLKHFPKWPEQKADAMREAAFGYRDLKNLELEVSSFNDNKHQPAAVALKKIQALQDKLEHSVHNTEKAREKTSGRYKDFKIPTEWMLDTGIVAQLKLGSMKLAREYMNRIVATVKSDALSDYEGLMLQGVRFAFRVHQFAGGFDEESRHAFQEFKKLSGQS